MPSPLIWKIYPHNDAACSMSNLQAHLPQWPPFSQHALIAVVQQSRYSCYDGYLEDVAWTRAKGMMSTIGCAKVVSVTPHVVGATA